LKYSFFDWQKEAFENFLIYQEDHKKTPTHLMFNMATGTGKTLLMASTILYYYNQGYRHFLFFVNQNNIVMLADEAHHFNADTKKKDIQEDSTLTELKATSNKDEIEKKG